MKNRRTRMITAMQRRLFLKGSLAASAVGVAVGAGLLTPQMVLAGWNADAFAAKQEGDAIKALLGVDKTEQNDAISIKAPDIAENGAVVPITVSSDLPGIQSITILASANPVPLIASFDLGPGAEGFVSTRIKMGKTGDVVALVKAGDKIYANRKAVKVTIGGCGG
jgi:sulfur-oxidizing protein SoxY